MGGDRGKVCKPAVAVDADGDVADTEVCAAPQTLVAGPAGDVRVAGDAGAKGQGDAVPHSHHLARELMAQGDGRGTGKLALQKMPVGAADACCKDADQNLAGSGNGVRDLCQLDPADRLQPDCAHSLLSSLVR